MQLAAPRTPFAFRLAHLKLDFRQMAKAAHVFVGEVKAASGQINTHKLWAEEEERLHATAVLLDPLTFLTKFAVKTQQGRCDASFHRRL